MSVTWEDVTFMLDGLHSRVLDSEKVFDDEDEYLEILDRIQTLVYDFHTVIPSSDEDKKNILKAIKGMNDQINSKYVHAKTKGYASTSTVYSIRVKDKILISSDNVGELIKVKQTLQDKGIEGKGLEANFTSSTTGKRETVKGYAYNEYYGKVIHDLGYSLKDLSNEGLMLTKEEGEKYSGNFKRAKRRRELDNETKTLQDLLNDSKKRKREEIMQVEEKIRILELKKRKYDMIENRRLKTVRNDRLRSLDDVMKDSDQPETGVWAEFKGKPTDDYYKFRGKNKNEIAMLSELADKNSRVYYNEHSYIYMTLCARDNLNTKEIKSKLKPVITNKMYQWGYSKKLFKAALEKPSVDLLLVSVVLIFSASSAHSNLLIVDKEAKHVIRFEPHGRVSGSYNIIEVDNMFEVYVREYFPGYFYIKPSAYEALIGVQNIERQNISWSIKKSSNGRRLEAAGFCSAWCLLFAREYVNSYKEKNHLQVERSFTDRTPDELALLVRQFMHYVVNK